MSVAVLLASSRSHGNTRRLLDLAFPGEKLDIEDIGMLKIGFYSYEGVNDNDDFLPLIDRLIPHDTWLIATPLYWYTMSAQAKAFIDRLSALLDVHKEVGRKLRGKKLAVLCTGTDPAPPPSFDEPFSLTCSYLGITFLGTHYAQFRDLHPARPEVGREAESFIRTVVRGDA